MRGNRVKLIRKVLVFAPIVFSIAALVMCICLWVSISDIKARLMSVSFNSVVEQTVISNNYIVSGDSEVPSDSTFEGRSGGGTGVSDDKAASEKVSDDSIKAYLTFDDGPSVNTEEILRILREHNVRATFFVDGAGDGNPKLEGLYREIVEDGHTIGMHSYSHDYATLYDSGQSFESDLDKIHSLIYNRTGVDTKMYRFPGGSANEVSRLNIGVYADILHKHGYQYWDWNVYPGDPDGKKLTADEISENVLGNIGSYRTAVILLHDTGTKDTTVEALPDIIEGLLDRKIDILPMNEDTPLIQQRAE